MRILMPRPGQSEFVENQVRLAGRDVVRNNTGRIWSCSILQCGQVKSSHRSMRNGAFGLPKLLPSGPAARHGSSSVSASANIFILLCYTNLLTALSCCDPIVNEHR